LILLHGVGSNEADLMGLEAELDDRFLIVSLRAPIEMGYGSYGWYHVTFTPNGPSADPVEAKGSLVKLRRAVDEVIAAYDADPERVYLMGFSQGCIMSLGACLTEPRKFAGIVGMSGRVPIGIEDEIAKPSEMSGLPILIVHGTADRVLTINEGRAIRDLLQKLPVKLEYHEYPMAHQVSRESLDEVKRWLTRQLDGARDWRAPEVKV
jgi:phospholipase/carboxylesterase